MSEESDALSKILSLLQSQQETANSNALYPDAPVIFSDGVTNFANSEAVVKFYLSRLDPATDGKSDAAQKVAAQVIMSMQSFLNTFLFFERMLDVLTSQGYFDADSIKKLRASQGQS